MEEEWFVGRRGTRSGPFPTDTVRRMVAAGEIRPSDLVWTEGMVDWVPLATVRELSPAPVPALGPLAIPPAVASDNPYAAPAASDFPVDAMADASGAPLRYAGYMPRVAATLIDVVLLMIVSVASTFGFAMLFGALLAGDLETAGAATQGCGQIVSLIIGVIYFVVLETSTKQGTLGKQLLGIKVTDMRGGRIGVGRALARYFAKIITGCTFGIGYLTPLFTDRKQTLHDMVAGCLALRK